MSKIVAIDFGLKRSGIAITDDTKMFAFGLDTVDSRELMEYVKNLVAKESVDTIVLGLPLRLNTEDAHITENVRMFKVALENEIEGIVVELVDERFTSKMASHSMHAAGASRKQKKDKRLIDKVSATIILQSFLDQK